MLYYYLQLYDVMHFVHHLLINLLNPGLLVLFLEELIEMGYVMGWVLGWGWNFFVDFLRESFYFLSYNIDPTLVRCIQLDNPITIIINPKYFLSHGNNSRCFTSASRPIKQQMWNLQIKVKSTLPVLTIFLSAEVTSY